MTAGWAGCPKGRSARGGRAGCGPSAWHMRGAATLTCGRLGNWDRDSVPLHTRGCGGHGRARTDAGRGDGTPRRPSSWTAPCCPSTGSPHDMTAYTDDAYQGPGCPARVPFRDRQVAGECAPRCPSRSPTPTSVPEPRWPRGDGGVRGRNRRSVRKWTLPHRQARGCEPSVHPSGGSGSSGWKRAVLRGSCEPWSHLPRMALKGNLGATVERPTA